MSSQRGPHHGAATTPRARRRNASRLAVSLLSLYRKAQPPGSLSDGGALHFRDFHRSHLSHPIDLEQVRQGLDLGVFVRLTPSERGQGECLLLERLEGGGDSRAAVGLGLSRSWAAVAALRRAVEQQRSAGALASPANAEALWRIDRDPRAIEAVSTLALDPQVRESSRVEAHITLFGTTWPQASETLKALMWSDGAYGVRHHSFRGLLMVHGYRATGADDLGRLPRARHRRREGSPGSARGCAGPTGRAAWRSQAGHGRRCVTHSVAGTSRALWPVV